MVSLRFDALVVGAGPAGATAAYTLARGGARVALVDKAVFPREKACGDLVGPRGLQVLDDLGVEIPDGLDVGDMLVVGPTGRRVRLPSFAGASYPGRARVVVRSVLDASLAEAAVNAGAVPFTGRAAEPIEEAGRLAGFTMSSGREVRADFVIGADGAASRVGTAAGLVDPKRVLWGFAVRSYVEQRVDMPVIVLWDEEPRRALPGYGWIFPGPGGVANFGLGVGTLSDRSRGATAARLLPAFTAHLRALGLLDRDPGPDARRPVGGWLKMGMVGTTPAAGNVLLVGDAAGLVNPLQGEGIAQALGSGRAAAQAVLADPSQAARLYRDALASAHLPYHRITAALQGALLDRPRAVSALGRLLTAPGFGRAIAGGWSVFWTELLDGAPSGPPRSVAAASMRIGKALTGRGPTAAWFEGAYPTPPSRNARAAGDVALPADVITSAS
jgi:geranylgeranyl reductase family protein